MSEIDLREAAADAAQMDRLDVLFSPPWELTGTCNQCGRCCMINDHIKCEHLEITGEPGQPMAARCMKYDTRYRNMPIRMVDVETGGHIRTSICLGKTVTAAEIFIILTVGILKGCSYRRKP